MLRLALNLMAGALELLMLLSAQSLGEHAECFQNEGQRADEMTAFHGRVSFLHCLVPDAFR